MVPLFEIDVCEFCCFFCYLFVDVGVFVHGGLVMFEEGEPEVSFEGEFVEQEGTEVDVQMALILHGQFDVVFGYAYDAVFYKVAVHVLENFDGQVVVLWFFKLFGGFESAEVDEDALCVDDIGAIPFFCVESDDGGCFLAEFFHFLQVLDLGQHEVDVERHLCAFGASIASCALEGSLDVDEELLFELVVVEEGISEEIDEFH